MKKSILFIALAATASLVSCKKEGCMDPTAINYSEDARKDDGTCEYEQEETPAETMFLIGTATTSQNETVKLYAEQSVSVGYTRLFAEVKDASGSIMSGATVEFEPLMDMGMMQHACPIEQPVYNATTEKYEGALVFIMSSASGTWTVDVTVNGNPASFTVDVADAPTGVKEVGVYSGTDGKMYVVSFKRPVDWVVGSQTFDILIHRRDDIMNFPADDDFDIVFTPEMVSMGHGSTGNVDPVNLGNGLYQGTVNLSMPGDWRFHLELSKSSTIIQSDAFLDILF